MSSSVEPLLMLTTIPLDLQIKICTFLHPSDILALRTTCKILQIITRERIIWIYALHRICIDNSLFLPSVPILDMTDVELEKAALTPRRWITLCAEFEKQHPYEPGASLHGKTRRTIKHPLARDDQKTQVFLVPGGRYLVSYAPRGISVWDLGYTSRTTCQLLASVGPEGEEGETIRCLVDATSDGMGLIIVALSSRDDCIVYEIYPRSENPQLTKIASWGHTGTFWGRQSSNKVVSVKFCSKKLIYTVWDYRLNHSICFSVDYVGQIEVMVTATTIVFVYNKEMLIYGIPPLLPQAPDLLAYEHIPHISPLFRIPLPDDLKIENYRGKSVAPWYGSSQPLYFGVFPYDSPPHHFEIIIEPDLSAVSLHPMSTSDLGHHNDQYARYSICDGTFVSYTKQSFSQDTCGIYIRSISSRPPNVISGSISLNVLLSGSGRHIPSLCPASGRAVYLDGENNDTITILDFL